MIRILIVACLLVVSSCADVEVTRSDITMDSGRPMSDGLKAYDVEHYTLRNDVQVEQKSIAGSGAIRFSALQDLSILELDFDGLYTIDGIEDDGGPLEYTRDEAKIYVALRSSLSLGENHEVTVHYHGRPIEAERAPWDGGFVWSETPSGKPWIATAMQGEGCAFRRSASSGGTSRAPCAQRSSCWRACKHGFVFHRAGRSDSRVERSADRCF